MFRKWQSIRIHTKKKNLVTFLIILLLVATIIPNQLVYAPSITITWNFAHYSTNDGGIGAPNPRVFFTINDTTLKTNGIQDTITVLVNSTSDQSGITLTIPENVGDTGIFNNTNLILTQGNGEFGLSQTVNVTDNAPLLNKKPAVVETIVSGLNNTFAIGIQVNSTTTTPIGINFNLTETGPNTGIFHNTLHFTTGPPINGSAIKTKGGDIVSIFDTNTGEFQNLLIDPNSNHALGALPAKLGNKISAIYNGVKATATVDTASGGGGGGGGLIISPSIVLDVIAGKGAGYTSPPAFWSNIPSLSGISIPPDIKSSIENPNPYKPISPIINPTFDLPFVIDNKGFVLPEYSNTIVTNTETTGKPVLIKLHFVDETGMSHIALYTNIPGAGGELWNSDTYIIYEKDNPLQIIDPHRFFSNVTVTPSINGPVTNLLYNITFAKPMQKSDIVIRDWDTRKNTQDTKIFDAWQVIEPQKNTTNNQIAPNTTLQNKSVSNTPSGNTMPVLQNNNVDLVSDIKMWGGYSSQSISDSDLLKDLGINAKHIPSWFMKTTRWVVNGDMTQQDFVSAVKYMYENGLVK